MSDEANIWAGLNPPYRTIVADPPWDHSDAKGTALRDGKWVPAGGLPYSSMGLDQIKALPIDALVGSDAHLYLWTTNRYLRDSFAVAEAWGFVPVRPLVWCKSPRAPFIGGPFGGASIEFCLFARKGHLRPIGRAGRQWWQWPRGAHSAKPAAFGDVVESVSPGPYVELFARQPRLGWDAWGHGYETRDVYRRPA